MVGRGKEEREMVRRRKEERGMVRRRDGVWSAEAQ